MLEIVMTILTVLSLTLLIGFLSLVYVYYEANKRPKVTPKNFVHNDNDKKTVVCIGDSITQGAVSFDYVEALSTQFKNEYNFINAGINSDLAYNVFQRIDDIIKCNPDYVTILIGTNDCSSVLSRKNQRNLMRVKSLPIRPTKQWFEDNLVLILKTLKEKTNAKIALFSIPVIGETLDSIPLKKSSEYSEVIKKVAKSEKVTYLPLNEKQINFIKEREHKPKTLYKDGLKLFAYVTYMHYIFKMSWDDISTRKGLLLSIDHVHQNSTGGTMVVDFIKEFLKENN